MNAFIEKIDYFLQRHEKQALFFLFVLTLILRIVHVAIIYHSNGTTKWGDDWEYLSMGRQIAAGDWSPKVAIDGLLINMRVGPIIPVLIALFIKIFGNPYFPFFFYNVVLTSLVVIVLFYLGKNVFNRKIGWLLAFWGVINIEFFRNNPHLLKEATVFLFLPLTLLFLVKSIRTNSSVKNIFFASLSFSWLIHSDERYFMYLPIFAFAFLLVKPLKIKKTIQLVSLWVGFIFLLMIPWGMHNYKVFDQVVIISSRTTVFTSKIWGANFDKKIFDQGTEKDKVRYGQTLEFAEEYGITPRKYGKFEAYARAFINFWQPTYFKATYIRYGFSGEKWSLAHNLAGLIFYGVFLPFYFLGIIFLIKIKYLMGIFIAFIPIVHSIFHTYWLWPIERYRSPINFIVVMIGTWAILRLFEKRKIVVETEKITENA